MPIMDTAILIVVLTVAVAAGMALYFWLLDPRIRPTGATQVVG